MGHYDMEEIAEARLRGQQEVLAVMRAERARRDACSHANAYDTGFASYSACPDCGDMW